MDLQDVVIPATLVVLLSPSSILIRMGSALFPLALGASAALANALAISSSFCFFLLIAKSFSDIFTFGGGGGVGVRSVVEGGVGLGHGGSGEGKRGDVTAARGELERLVTILVELEGRAVDAVDGVGSTGSGEVQTGISILSVLSVRERTGASFGT